MTLPSEARQAYAQMSDFGRANFPLKDGNFTSNLNKARPAEAPTF
ncbi:NPP1 family protein [Streptomyces sp. CA-251387]